ncbi:MAG: alpha/beta hydrolase [Acidimicrobiales bacterium]|nr:alpha/beta hydrolase [Acidimicrobiales bacterium]
MATYVLIHGAASDSWYWHRVVPMLRERGHDLVAPDLPCDDDSAGLAEYADAVVEAVGDRRDLVVVAQSMAGFTAPLVCDRLPARLLVLVAAMVPLPGEAPGDWWANTGQPEAMREQAERDGRPPVFKAEETFFHDVPPDVVAEAFARGERTQSGTPFEKPWPMDAWPDVPTRFLLCRDDRFFPAEFMRRVVKERLGIVPDEIDSGHLPALSRPQDLVDRLEAYRLEQAPPSSG